jgi:hypothetical protein
MNDARENAESANAGSRSRPGLASVLLGVFIIWELVYLPAANFIKLLPVRQAPHKGELDDEVQIPADESASGPAQVVRDGAAAVLSRWGELTGQAQGWALFAPTFGHQASLPAVGFGGTTFHSSFKPVDPHVYFRTPWPSCRLFNYEYRLALLYWRWTPESYREHPEEWRQAAVRRVRWQHRSMLAYMRWRLDKYLRRNPKAVAPTVVGLYAELIPSPPPEAPDAMRQAPMTFGLARWLPGTPPPPGNLPIQAGRAWLPEED